MVSKWLVKILQSSGQCLLGFLTCFSCSPLKLETGGLAQAGSISAHTTPGPSSNPRSTTSNSTYTPNAVNLAARKWFQDAKFGLFIHWGVYSVLGEGEWVMNEKRIPISEYENLPPQFNPTEFNPAEWVALAKAAGMKYITITSKHHDGFGMFDSKVSDYDIVDRTPYKKDVLKMLAEECKKQGIKLFFYHSHLDWHHPDYFPLGRTGHYSGRAAQGDWYKYLDYMDDELRELCSNYGEIGGIWFDGWWDKPDADWRLDKTYKLIHELQPQALVGNNHHRKPFAGEDFQMFEKDLPGGKTAEFNKDAEIGDLPLETCETINKSWGYNKNDKSFKSERELLHYLIRAGHNANCLLNIGPLPTGTIQPEFVTQLKAMGQWISKNGDSIYGTRGGPIAPRPWGVTTHKGNKVYLHILDWQDTQLPIPPLRGIIRSAKFMKTGRKADLIDTGYGLVLLIPEGAIDPIDTIVVLEM
ncbi:MAG: alpha-L-fucosidase [Acidobacteria bacterium]|nr:MAG: alpha-L-fucosidase [Acidobacteriota bacterium]